MLNFEYNLPTLIVFGKEQQLTTGKQIKPYGKKVLIHHYGDVFSEVLISEIKASLDEESIEYIELTGVKPNPRLSLVKEGVELCAKHGVDFILAVGGGSVIDSAKAIGLGNCYEGDVWDFFIGEATPEKMTPVGVVLTIAAAGSECSNGSVITNEDGWIKRAYTHGSLRPVFAIMNPEITYTVPNYLTNCGSADIMAHAMERYFTNVKHVELTDRITEGILKTVINNAPIIDVDPYNYDARAEVMWAGNLAHNEIAGTGRMGDYGSHYLGHELSAMFDIAHGATLAIMFPAWMKYVYKHDVPRFVQFAERVWNVEVDYNDLEGTALKGIEAMVNFFKMLKLPVTLKEVNIERKDIPELARKCTYDGDKGEFVKITQEVAEKIFELAYE